MEHFFRSLKLEWMPTLGYSSLIDAKNAIVKYVVVYYSQLRPHQHNNGLASNLVEQKYCVDSKVVAKNI